MSERELRQILDEVISEIDAGRIDLRSRRLRLGRWLGPPLVAATLGLTGASLGTGCTERSVGTSQDASTDARVGLDSGSVDAYGIPYADAAVDSGNVDLYGVVPEDAGIVDAAIDGDIPLPYAAPPILDPALFA